MRVMTSLWAPFESLKRHLVLQGWVVSITCTTWTHAGNFTILSCFSLVMSVSFNLFFFLIVVVGPSPLRPDEGCFFLPCKYGIYRYWLFFKIWHQFIIFVPDFPSFIIFSFLALPSFHILYFPPYFHDPVSTPPQTLGQKLVTPSPTFSLK